MQNTQDKNGKNAQQGGNANQSGDKSHQQSQSGQQNQPGGHDSKMTPSGGSNDKPATSGGQNQHGSNIKSGQQDQSVGQQRSDSTSAKQPSQHGSDHKNR